MVFHTGERERGGKKEQGQFELPIEMIRTGKRLKLRKNVAVRKGLEYTILGRVCEKERRGRRKKLILLKSWAVWEGSGGEAKRCSCGEPGVTSSLCKK